MLGSKIRALNNEVMEKAKKFQPNLENYNLMHRDDFHDLWEKDVQFSQVTLTFHSHIDYDDYLVEEKYVLLGFSEAKKLKKEVQAYKDKLEEIQKELASERLETYDIETYLAVASFGIDIRVYKRRRSEEEAYKIKRDIIHQYKMENDEEYRKTQEWFQEQERPFGGAFSSWEDYYRHVGVTVD